MSTITENSDSQLLEMLRRRGAMSIAAVAAATEVTATAVRQRMTRLMAQGLVRRDVARTGRGRPGHKYSATDKARRQAGNNFADLAMVLWEEIRAVKDPEIRRGLLERLAISLSKLYAGRVQGATTADRLASMKTLFAERNVPLEIEAQGASPGLTVLDCPYPELAERDRSVCALERMLFAELLERPVKLSQCRLDGHACCQFETNE